VQVLTVASQKGGVGKTATTVNLAAGLALAGYRVLVVDLEPQAQAGRALGVNLLSSDLVEKSLGVPLQLALQGLRVNMHDYVVDRSDLLMRWGIEGRLGILASEDQTMTQAQTLLHAAPREKVLILRHLLAQLHDEYDWAVIDTPPNVSALPSAALAASDYAITLCNPLYQTIEGPIAMHSSLKFIHSSTNGEADPRYLGALLNMSNRVDEWTREEVMLRNGMVQANLLPLVTEIRKDARISGAYADGEPAVIKHAKALPGQRYADLLQEIFTRIDSDPSEWEIAPSADEVLAEREAAKSKAAVRA
jgi:chromosome partitioning protein